MIPDIGLPVVQMPEYGFRYGELTYQGEKCGEWIIPTPEIIACDTRRRSVGRPIVFYTSHFLLSKHNQTPATVDRGIVVWHQ